MVERGFRVALLTQDDEVVGIIDEPSAEALPKSELPPSQHEPAHVQICQQW
jgi:hypothetical protein